MSVGTLLAGSDLTGAVAAQVLIQTAANAAAARASAGGTLYTIATPTSTTPAPVDVNFAFVTPSPTNPLAALANLAVLRASFAFLGTAAPGNPATSSGGIISQRLDAGSFSFTYAGSKNLVVNHKVYRPGTNLLSATFTNAAITGDGSRLGSFDGSTDTGATLSYTSDFLKFDPSLAESFALTGTFIVPVLQFRPNQSLTSFATASDGFFRAKAQPAAAIPEPAMWATMMVGFGLIGVSFRRRGTAAAA